MKKKVMVVDDQPTVRKLLVNFLNKKYHVLEMADAQQALNYIENENIPDAIITDVMMPNISGVELLSILQQKNGKNTPPIIMLSGIENSSEKVKCLKKGASDYIVKPFNPEELNIRLENLLNN